MIQRAFQALAFACAVLIFGITCLTISAVALVARLVLPRQTGHRLGRALILSWFRLYFRLLRGLGLMRVDLAALDQLREGPALILAPNHPSLLDAMLIASRLEQLGCVMKASVLESIYFGPVAQLAGFISNTTLRGIIRGVKDDIERGRHVLLFPEGTRSVNAPINPVPKSFAMIAARVGVPIQTVLIETNTPYLSKGWPIVRMPRFPLEYRVRLGPRFDPPGRDLRHFLHEFESALRCELSQAELGGPVAGVPYAASASKGPISE